jgi:hypothetical protein
MRAMALLLALVAVAHADSAQDEIARAHFISGQSYYDGGKYAEALKSFTEAYRLSRRPALLYNVALCHERLGRIDRAIDALENYLADAGQVRDRTAVERHVAELKARLAEDAARPAPPPVVPVVVTPQPPAPPPTPSYKKGWVWGLALGVVAVVGVGVGLGVGLGTRTTPSPSWGSVDLRP